MPVLYTDTIDDPVSWGVSIIHSMTKASYGTGPQVK